MAIEFVCPSCGGTLRVADEAAGTEVRCGNCMGKLRVPVPPGSEAESPPPTTDEDPFPRRRAIAEPVTPPDPRPTRREDTDEFGEPRPRRRRRRPAPPPSVRSGLFWVLMAFLLVSFITAAACGGVFLFLQPKWRTHQSGRGGFKVDLPAEARADMEDIARANGAFGDNVRIEGTILLVKLEEYSVVYADVEPVTRQFRTDEDILDDAVDGLKDDDPGVKIVRNIPVKVSDFPARDVAFTHPDGNAYVCRIIIAGTRLYILTAGGPNVDSAGNERTRRFLDSFEVTDPQLAAQGKGPKQKGLEQAIWPPRERERVKD